MATSVMSVAVLQRLQMRAAQAEQIITQLREQLAVLKKTAAVSVCEKEEAVLKAENTTLRQEIQRKKQQLTEVEVRNGLKQFALPQISPASMASAVVTTQPEKPVPVKTENKAAAAGQATPVQKDTPQNQPKKEKKKGEPKAQKPPAEAAPVDVSRLNMRIGYIRSAKKHPDADGLYVEEVDLGEDRCRTIVSGLVKFVPLEQMENRYAIFMVNLKPAKMRGIMSEGMIMCGSSPEIIEIINPPQGVAIGERVTVDGYPGEPDGQLNPKKKIWEQTQPDLQINGDGAATYKGALWKVGEKGICTVPTMRNSIIK